VRRASRYSGTYARSHAHRRRGVWPYPPALFWTDWVGGGPPLCAPGTSGYRAGQRL